MSEAERLAGAIQACFKDDFIDAAAAELRRLSAELAAIKAAIEAQGVPDGWQPIETAPESMDECVVVGWLDDEGLPRTEFDYKEDGCWIKWHEHAEHTEVIGGHGVSYTPPYTHWLKLPPLASAPPAPQVERSGCTAGTDEECKHKHCAAQCPKQANKAQSDTLYLLRRLLSNQHTLTGSEFREELTKIVEQASVVQQEPKFWYDEEDGLLYAPNEEKPAGCIALYANPAQQAKPQPLSDDRDARIAELEQRNRDLHEDVKRFRSHALNEKDARMALERELAEARKDAERYRWLRDLDEDPVMSLAAQYTDMNGSAKSISQRIDAAIDAAVRKGKS